MLAYKDNRQGTWYASFYVENWQGVKQKKLKRGFATKKDALAWEREFPVSYTHLDVYKRQVRKMQERPKEMR